jgi:Tfp pilus assembly protein FimT
MSLAFTRVSRAALTFAEILVVVATIALLVASALPSLFRRPKRRHPAEIFHDLRANGSFVGPIRGLIVK